MDINLINPFSKLTAYFFALFLSIEAYALGSAGNQNEALSEVFKHYSETLAGSIELTDFMPFLTVEFQKKINRKIQLGISKKEIVHGLKLPLTMKVSSMKSSPDGCLLINGVSSLLGKSSLHLGFRKKDRWLLDSIHFDLIEPEQPFAAVPACEVNLPH